MGKLEELMQEVMKVITQQGFLPDSVELKVKVGENWYSVRWKQPSVYAVHDELDLFDEELERRKKKSKARKKGK